MCTYDAILPLKPYSTRDRKYISADKFFRAFLLKGWSFANFARGGFIVIIYADNVFAYGAFT